MEQKRMAIDKIAEYPNIVEVAKRWTSPATGLLELCIEIQQIPAPTGEEAARTAWVAEKMAALGLQQIVHDRANNNVYGCWPGKTRKPGVLITAHTDTVFGFDTALTVRHDLQQARVYGPGIGDNSLGVAALLELLAATVELPAPPVDIWFAANSQEEGLGDLRGMRAVVDDLGDQIGACVVLEGMGLGRVVHRALGSRRYRISVSAPGGHSWSDFGSASALHVIAELATELTKLDAPETPRTSFNIGRLDGGTSVNTIAQHAWLELDLRSEDQASLAKIVADVLEIVQRFQTAKWQHRGVQVVAEVIGDRPSGGIAEDHPLVMLATAALQAVDYLHPTDLRMSSG
jgi:acetylornithine deacetylase/succinyl-diaminopimelate desuccinylase-like protein